MVCRLPSSELSYVNPTALLRVYLGRWPFSKLASFMRNPVLQLELRERQQLAVERANNRRVNSVWASVRQWSQVVRTEIPKCGHLWESGFGAKVRAWRGR